MSARIAGEEKQVRRLCKVGIVLISPAYQRLKDHLTGLDMTAKKAQAIADEREVCAWLAKSSADTDLQKALNQLQSRFLNLEKLIDENKAESKDLSIQLKAAEV